MKGNEQDCICHKPKGKHTKYCDAYRLSEFFKKCAANQKDMPNEFKDVINDNFWELTE